MLTYYESLWLWKPSISNENWCQPSVDSSCSFAIVALRYWGNMKPFVQPFSQLILVRLRRHGLEYDLFMIYRQWLLPNAAVSSTLINSSSVWPGTSLAFSAGVGSLPKLRSGGAIIAILERFISVVYWVVNIGWNSVVSSREKWLFLPDTDANRCMKGPSLWLRFRI